jgi:hypothetical protein
LSFLRPPPLLFDLLLSIELENDRGTAPKDVAKVLRPRLTGSFVRHTACEPDDDRKSDRRPS